MRHCLSFFLFATFSFAAASAQSRQVDEGISFSDQILPILQEKFAPVLVEETGLELDSWQSLIKGSDFGQVLIPFDPESSLLIRLATRLSDDHPLRATADLLSEDDVALVHEWIGSGARNDAGEIPYADAANLLYACSEGAAAVSVIDMDAQVVIRTIKLEELGFTSDSRPHHVAVEPDGSAWYVSLIGDDVVLKFNRKNELIGQIGFERPGMLALHGNEDLLFVGRSMKAVNPPQRIGIIERSSMDIDEIDVFFPRPHALAIHPGGERMYVGSLAENRVAILDIASESVELSLIEGPTHTLVQFALTPDGNTMVAGGQLTGRILFFDTTNPANPTLVDSIAVGAAPWHPVFTPGGQYVWFGNKMAGTVTVVDVKERRVEAVIEGLSQPHGSAASPDGHFVFISNNNLSGAYQPRYDFGEQPGVVAVLDVAERRIKRMLEIGPNATGLGTAPH